MHSCNLSKITLKINANKCKGLNILPGKKVHNKYVYWYSKALQTSVLSC